MKKTSAAALLSILLASGSVEAALSENAGTVDTPAIETSGGELRPIDQMLGGGNHPDLFGAVLHQHNIAAQPSSSMMEGYFGSDGAEQPVLFGMQSPSLTTMAAAAPEQPAKPTDLSLTAAVQMGGRYQGSDASTTQFAGTSAAADTNSASNAVNTGTDNGNNGNYSVTTVITPINPSQTETSPVPLPAAGLLLASGLLGLPAMGRLRRD